VAEEIVADMLTELTNARSETLILIAKLEAREPTRAPRIDRRLSAPHP
jgi:hypothetical protein